MLVRTETDCGHFGEHRGLEVYPDNCGSGVVFIGEMVGSEDTEPIELVAEKGIIHTVKVQCLTCNRISLIPMTFLE